MQIIWIIQLLCNHSNNLMHNNKWSLITSKITQLNSTPFSRFHLIWIKTLLVEKVLTGRSSQFLQKPLSARTLSNLKTRLHLWPFLIVGVMERLLHGSETAGETQEVSLWAAASFSAPRLNFLFSAFLGLIVALWAPRTPDRFWSHGNPSTEPPADFQFNSVKFK